MQQFVALPPTTTVGIVETSRDRAATGTRGTERGPRTDTLETVLVAAFQILINEGAHALTPQRIFNETGVARTTIYRHWPTTADLITTMLHRATGDQDLAEVVGDLATDLGAAVDNLVFRFNHRPLRPLFGALVEHGRQGGDDDIAAEYVRGVVAPIRRAVQEGVDCGDLELDDLDAAVLDLTGPLLTKHVLLGQTVTEAEGRAAVERFLEENTGSADDGPATADVS